MQTIAWREIGAVGRVVKNFPAKLLQQLSSSSLRLELLERMCRYVILVCGIVIVMILNVLYDRG